MISRSLLAAATRPTYRTFVRSYTRRFENNIRVPGVDSMNWRADAWRNLAVVNLLLWGAAYYVNYVGDLGHFGSVVYPATDRENPLEVN